MTITSLIPLIDHVSLLRRQHDKLAKLTGNRFNIFSLLKVTTDEVKLHSALIGDLLNPYGPHDQDDLFLKLFRKTLNLEDSIDSQTCNVYFEYHTGFITEDKEEGGRLDIMMTDCHNKRIIIENKIYAGDQDKQLKRYKSFDGEATILYLTLDGSDASPESSGGLIAGTDYHLISYQTDILNWLTECRKECVQLPTIRETLSQYIALVKSLTGSNMDESLDQDIADYLLSNSANISVAFTLVNSITAFRHRLIEKLNADLEALNPYPDLNMWSNLGFNSRHTGVFFYEDSWDGILSIAFQFQGVRYGSEMRYGINYRPSDITTELRAQIRLSFEDVNTWSTHSWWPIYKPFDPYSNWVDQAKPWIDINNGSMAKFIIEQVQYIYPKLKSVKLPIV